MRTHKPAGNPEGKGRQDRGVIDSFSPAARRRMRDFMLTQHVPDALHIVEGSVTVPGTITDDQWRTSFKQWCQRLKRAGIAFIWRIELQPRINSTGIAQPHVHFVAYVPTDAAAKLLSNPETWLQCLESCLPPEDIYREAAYMHAVHCKKVDAEHVEWLAYCTAHSSKAKNSQLGWKGKQWGIVNRKLFSERPSDKIEFDNRQGILFRRWVRRFLQSKTHPKYRKFVNLGSGSFSRIMHPGIPQRIANYLLLHEHDKPVVIQFRGNPDSRKTYSMDKPRTYTKH